jgi:hypothetical protein
MIVFLSHNVKEICCHNSPANVSVLHSCSIIPTLLVARLLLSIQVHLLPREVCADIFITHPDLQWALFL